MKLKQITAFADRLLKGRRSAALLVCLMPLGTVLFFRLGEAAMYSIILYFSGMAPAGLFSGDSPVQQLAAVIFTLLRYLAAAPMIYSAAYWYLKICGDENRKRRIHLSPVILNARNYRRSLAALLLSKAVGFVFLIPSAFFGAMAVRFISDSMNNTRGLQLLMAVHASVTAVIALGLWIWAKTALLALPFLLVRFPERNVCRLVYDSFRFMRGRRTTAFKIFARYLLPMLLIVTIPFLLPELFAAFSLFISISLREDEYLEENHFYSRHRQAGGASKLSAWAKRRFTAASDQAEAAGIRDNL